jgi:hypothetical protein
VRRRSRRTAKQSGFRSMKKISSWLLCCKFQFSSNNEPKYEFLPAFASVVAVVSKILPPTLNFTVSLCIVIVEIQ